MCEQQYSSIRATNAKLALRVLMEKHRDGLDVEKAYDRRLSGC